MTGLATFVPGVGALSERKSGGTSDPLYCYWVWLRHWRLLSENGLPGVPTVVAELGPGDSLGAGIAALLTGARSYYALDVVKYADTATNLRVFDSLVQLFRERTPIPEGRFSTPLLEKAGFPEDFDVDELLSPQRLAAIRAAIVEMGVKRDGFLLSYEPSWTGDGMSLPEQPEVIFSQTVLQYVDDLPQVYRAMHRWLSPGGYVSHQIDFSSQNFARAWNGHWSYSDFSWRMIRGRRRYAINRAPLMWHLRHLEEAGFGLIEIRRVTAAPLERHKLAKRFVQLTDADLTTASAYLQGRKTELSSASSAALDR